MLAVGPRDAGAAVVRGDPVAEAWLQRAQCRFDMAKVAAGRPKFKLGEQAIQWGWIRGQVARLHLSPDRLAALLGVMAGDAVPAPSRRP